jgi:hypothetical protein
MLALMKIRQSGFTVSLVDGCIEISPFSKLTPTQRDFLKSHKAEIISELCEVSELSHADEKNILAWLAYIEETDPETIAETLDRCRSDTETLAYFLTRAAEVPPPEAPKPVQMITCRDCTRFQSFNAHGRGAGSCQAGIQLSGAALWSETQHACDQHLLKIP